MGEATRNSAPDTSGFTLQVYVPADQVASARPFYARLFGRDPDFEPHDDFLEWAPIAGQECFFQVAGRSPASALGNRVRFRVRDLAAAVVLLDECGIAHSVPSRLPDVVAFLNFADPWGNQLGYYEDLVPTEQQRTYPGTSVSDESQFEDHQV
ncbi:VOC family protein [Brevibacterium casei]|uniref:Glyoxalase n=1 Tax=Brevibacterium casei TaxID=33889 RepID=A0A7T3ZX21_9MICO|nr:hypothetical protein [Brevibacterium casei]QQB13233.1 hypothetical protein I6H47_10265 [Brevibacterium casei]